MGGSDRRSEPASRGHLDALRSAAHAPLMETIRGWASGVTADGVELIVATGGTRSFEVENDDAMAKFMEAFHDGQARLYDLDDAGRIVAVRPDPTP